MQAIPAQRGGILSLYLALFYGALSAGQLLIHIADPATAMPFWIIAFLSSLSILPLILTVPIPPKIENSARLTTTALFKISPFGLSGVVVSGILLGAVYGMVPVYAKEIGLAIPQIGNFMALLVFGGLCFQWPLGKLADLWDRRNVLLTASILTALCSIAIIFTQDIIVLFLLAFLFGGFSFTIYPLSMAHACEKVNDSEIVSTTSGFVLCYGVGAIVGPLIAPIAMNVCGTSGLFYFLAAISSVLALIGSKKQKNDKMI